MRKAMYLLVALAAASAAQTNTTYSLTGPGIVRGGQTTQLWVTVQDGADSQGSAWQWSVTFPAGVTVTNPTMQAGIANALMLCTIVAQTSSCILIPNAAQIPAGTAPTKIANGQLASYSVQIPAAASGTLGFQIAGVYGATPVGSTVPTVAGTPYQMQVAPKQDIDGDGKVTTQDITLMSQEVLASFGNPSACVHDLDGDGKCTVLDVMSVLLKYLGLI